MTYEFVHFLYLLKCYQITFSTNYSYCSFSDGGVVNISVKGYPSGEEGQCPLSQFWEDEIVHEVAWKWDGDGAESYENDNSEADSETDECINQTEEYCKVNPLAWLTTPFGTLSENINCNRGCSLDDWSCCLDQFVKVLCWHETVHAFKLKLYKL